MINDLVSTTKKDVIDMIYCAETYGFDSMVVSFLFSLLNYNLTEEEIEEFSRDLGQQEGYSEEDYEASMETLKFYAKIYNQ